MLNNTDLTALRALQNRLLTGTCTLWRNTPTISASGGQTDSWTVVATLPCRLAPERDRRLQQIIGEKPVLEVYYRLTLPHDADLRAGDRLECAGAWYQVVALWEAHTLKTAIRAVVSRVQ